jgi:D-alanyl-D-alanine carboxypeptidase
VAVVPFHRPPTPEHWSVGRRAAAAATALAVVLLAIALGGTLPGGRELSRPAATPRALGSDDGDVAVGGSLSPFSDEPAIANLDPALRDAVRRAATDARADGIELRVTSGWRSARYQRALLRRAEATYGSVELARKYVMPPAESSHVTGKAVDVGPTDADSWLSQHGSEYGLCQIYANERWHFERAVAPGGTCPAMAGDASDGSPGDGARLVRRASPAMAGDASDGSPGDGARLVRRASPAMAGDASDG